jgi:Alpha/beta hydrolase of unknown function (DUF900)
MNFAIAVLVILLIAIALGTVGCTSNLPFRTNFESTGGDSNKAVIESTADYKLGFVEFDDQGWFWNTRQRSVVEQMIRDEAGISSAGGATPQGIILVAFVHGWKDNAAYDNEGVEAFRDILEQLNEAEKAQTSHPARKVVGVYLGWRGLSVKWWPFDEFTFWGRKDTAHKVGGYGAMTEMLVDLENIQANSLHKLAKDAPPTELIIIGHSFGGAAVYTALSQIITERFVDTLDKGKRLKPVGDQVILLNPAFEANRHYDLNQMALAIKKYPQDQRPVLSIFQSEGDWAPHYAFPMGRFFSTLLDSNRDNEQKTAGLETAGWFKPFVNHELDYDQNASVATTRASTFNAQTQKHEYHDHSAMVQSVNNIEIQRGKWNPSHTTAQTYYFDDTVLKPIDDYHPGDPFMIVSVDPRIMRDHSDITNKVLINFLREYIQFCQVDSKDHSK